MPQHIHTLLPKVHIFHISELPSLNSYIIHSGFLSTIEIDSSAPFQVNKEE